jgi:hypothetical protein
MSNSFLSGSIPPIRPAGPEDATWIVNFLRDRWSTTTIVVQGELIEGCERLWLTTTNDKLSALRFYKRRGFRVIQARPGAVDAARKLKPTIPVIGEHGIPVQEEIDLCRVLATDAAEDLTPGRRGAGSHPGGRKYAMTVKKADKARNPT